MASLIPAKSAGGEISNPESFLGLTKALEGLVTKPGHVLILPITAPPWPGPPRPDTWQVPELWASLKGSEDKVQDRKVKTSWSHTLPLTGHDRKVELLNFIHRLRLMSLPF